MNDLTSTTVSYIHKIVLGNYTSHTFSIFTILYYEDLVLGKFIGIKNYEKLNTVTKHHAINEMLTHYVLI